MLIDRKHSVVGKQDSVQLNSVQDNLSLAEVKLDITSKLKEVTDRVTVFVKCCGSTDASQVKQISINELLDVLVPLAGVVNALEYINLEELPLP